MTQSDAHPLESSGPRMRGVVPSPGHRSLGRRIADAALSYGMVAPVLLLVALVLGFPLVFNIYLGFTNASAYTGLTNLSITGLANYEYLVTDLRFRSAFGLTLVWTALNLSLQLLLGLILALLLHGSPLRLAKIVQPIWLLPWIIPAVSAFYVWRLFYNANVGPIHLALRDLGLITTPILADAKLALWGIIAAAVWKGFPFYMVMFYSGLQAVPQDLYDAARVDGANRWHVFRYIELPELSPIAGMAGALGFVWIFNWFTPVYAMTGGGPGGATTTVGIYIYEEAIRGSRFGTAAVAGTGLIILVIIFFALSQWIRRRANTEAKL